MTTTATAPPSAASYRRRGAVARVLALTGLLSRPSRQGRAALVLPITAFAITTGLLLTVVGGAMMFLRAAFDGTLASETALVYAALALLAVALLVIPLASLAGAAARLSARRRDDRLATLRLLGASSGEVRTMTVVEATALAATGSIVGIALHAALVPLVGLLPFFGSPIGPAAVWVGWPIAAATPAAIAILAALSSVIGLRRVALTPLGVRARTDAPRIRWIGVVIGVAAVAIGYAALNQLNSFGEAFGVVAMIAVVALVFAGGLAVLNLIGPPVVAALGRLRARRAKTAADLIAGRQLIEQSKVAWRRVSGIAVISFVAVVGGVGVALSDMAGVDDDFVILAADMRTGVVLTLAIAFLLLACSVAITSAAAVLDDAELLRGLDRLGMPVRTMERARRITVLAPLRLACLAGAGAGGVLVLPLVGISILTGPATLVTIAVAFVAGFAVVLLGLLATRPVVRAVLAESDRAL